MRRLGRWILKAATALSLLMCVGTIGLCVRSYWMADAIDWRDAAWRINLLEGSRGEVIFVSMTFYSTYNLQDRAWKPSWHLKHEPLPGSAIQWQGNDLPTTDWSHLGIQYHAGDWQGSAHEREWHVPYWMIALATGVLPLGIGVRRVQLRRRRAAWGRAGRCTACGYDLTGNVSGVCPECGKVVDDG